MVHRHDGPDHAASRSDDAAAKAAAEAVVAKIEQAEAAADKQEDANGNGDAKSDLDADRTVAPGPRSDEIGDPHSLRHRRDWHHIPHTRVRTSTAIVSVLFIVCVVLYGYTSQRYGIVEPPPAPTHHRTTVQTTPSATYSSPTSYPSSTEPSDSLAPSVGGSEEPGAPGEQGTQTGEPSGQPTTTSRNGPFDLFNRQTQQNETPAVPSR